MDMMHIISMDIIHIISMGLHRSSGSQPTLLTCARSASTDAKPAAAASDSSARLWSCDLKCATLASRRNSPRI
jgi:hypothetical protein|eukprot:COSAG01_NODE_12990_length_1652_cov_2.455892_1_plen_73_part_00